MENLNAEQIKSDLAICVLGDCQACHYNKVIGCYDELCGDALALINSQEQRIKELGEERDGLYRLVDDKIQEIKKLTEHNAQILQFGEEWEALARKFEAENKKLTEENERLQDEADRYKRYYFNHEYDKFEAEVRADTVRKMRERLKATSFKIPCGSAKAVFVSVIDQIAKEMLEGEING